MSRRSSRARGRRPVRKNRRVGSLRRQVLLALAGLSIPVGLFFSIQRSAAGTALAATLTDLREETQVLQETLAEEAVRVDSLESRERIRRMATPLGLREAKDHEVVVLTDVRTPASAAEVGT